MLQQTEASLRRSIHEMTSEMSSLQTLKDAVERQLKDARADINQLEATDEKNKDATVRLTVQKEDLELSVSRLQDEARDQGAKLHLNDKELGAAKQQLKYLEQETSDSAARLSELEIKLKDLEAAKAEITKEAQLLRHQHAEDEQLMSFNAARINELQHEINGYQGEVGNLETKISEHEQMGISLRTVIKALEDKNAELEERHVTTASKLVGAENELEETHTALGIEQKKAEELTALRDDLNKRIAAHEKRANISDNVIRSLREQLADLKATVASLEQGKNRLHEDLTHSNSQLRNAHGREQQLKSQVANLEKSIGEHQDSAASLRSRLDTAEANSSQRAVDMHSELDGVSEKLLQTQAKYTECSIKLSASEKSRKEAHTELVAANQAHSQALDALESERQRSQALDAQIINDRDGADSVKQLLSEVQHNFDNSKREHYELQTAKSSLEAELGHLRSEKVAVEEQLTRQSFRCTELNDQLGKAASTQRSLGDKLDQLRSLSQRTDGDMAELRSSLRKAVDSSSMHQKSSEAAQEETTTLTAQIQLLKAKLDQLQELEREHLDKVAVNQRSITALEQQLAKAQADQDLAHNELGHASKKIVDLEALQTQLDGDLRASRQEIQSLRSIIETLREEVGKAQQQMEALENEKKKLSDEFQAVNNTNSRLRADNTSLTKDLDAQRKAVESSRDQKAALDERLRASEEAATDLHGQIKQLTCQSRDTHSQLRKSHAIRVSHENALGSIRVRLGASKMAKRGAQIKLSQAEKELSSLRTQNERLEKTLANALSEVVEGRNLRSGQREKILDLQTRHEKTSQILVHSEESVIHLQERVWQLEQESADFKHEIARLKTVVDRAESEIASLKSEIASLNEHRAKDSEELASQKQQIAELQQAKIDHQKSLAEKSTLVETQQGDIARLKEQTAADEAAIARLDSEKISLTRLTSSLKADIDARDAAMLDQKRQIEKLEQDLLAARKSAQDLKSRMQEQESRNERLRLQNGDYAKEIPRLQQHIRDLNASKVELQAQTRNTTNVLDSAEKRDSKHDSVSAQASSPTLVMDDLEPPLEERDEYFDFVPISRPMSPNTRVGTSHSSFKALRVLGAEAAASQLGISEDEDMKKSRRDLWASQQRLGSLHEDEGQMQKEEKPAPRLRRKLTKKKKVEQLKPDGSALKNLVRYGSFSRPTFERPLSSYRSLSLKH
jgi:chromosome segregation ATPase